MKRFVVNVYKFSIATATSICLPKMTDTFAKTACNLKIYPKFSKCQSI